MPIINVIINNEYSTTLTIIIFFDGFLFINSNISQIKQSNVYLNKITSYLHA